MKFLKIAFTILVLLINFVVVPPVWADPIAEKSPEYTEITQTLDSLIQSASDPSAIGYTAESLQQKIANLQFQKYIMETTEDWGVCRNETPKTIGVYAHKPKKNTAVENTLYYLAAGQATDDDFDCDGIFLPVGSKVALTPTDTLGQELTEPIALKITDGTQLTITTTPEGVIQFNLPPAQILKANETTWSIPNLAQADVDATMPNAPSD